MTDEQAEFGPLMGMFLEFGKKWQKELEEERARLFYRLEETRKIFLERKHEFFTGYQVAENIRAILEHNKPETDWTFVSENKFPSQEYVLVCYEYLDTKERFVGIDHLSEHTPKSFFEGFYPLGDSTKRYRKVIAWMPLPEVPSGS
jgi:hypothetical protein